MYRHPTGLKVTRNRCSNALIRCAAGFTVFILSFMSALSSVSVLSSVSTVSSVSPVSAMPSLSSVSVLSSVSAVSTVSRTYIDKTHGRQQTQWIEQT